jgi:hypothetical protein
MKFYNYCISSLALLSAATSFAAAERATLIFHNKTGMGITLIFVTARDVGTAAVRAQVDIADGQNVNIPVTFDSNLFNGNVDSATFAAQIKSGALQEDALYRMQIIYNPILPTKQKQGYSIDLKKIYNSLSACGSKRLDVEFKGFPAAVNNNVPPFTIGCDIGEFKEIDIKSRPRVSQKTYKMLRLPENATEWQILGVKPDTSTEWVNKLYREKRGFFPNDPEALKLFDWAYHTINDKRAGETISYGR